MLSLVNKNTNKYSDLFCSSSYGFRDYLRASASAAQRKIIQVTYHWQSKSGIMDLREGAPIAFGLPAQARVVTKRTYTSGGMGDTSASTSYYITFEYLSGDRKEFYVPYREYGLIAEGDDGVLTFQGTRFIGFERALSSV